MNNNDISKENGLIEWEEDGVIFRVWDASKIKPRKTYWLWENRIPRGNLSIIYGDGGIGKSQTAIDIASRITNGDNFPDNTPCEKGGVLMLMGEDDRQATIIPRLQIAKSSLVSNTFIIDGTKETDNGKSVQHSLNLRNCSKLEKIINKLNKCIDPLKIQLLIVDPISAFLGGKDSYKDSEVREMLSPLAKMAEDYDIAVLMIAHVSKAKGIKASHKLMGSVGFNNAARSSFYVAENPDNSEEHIFCHVKSNLAKIQDSLTYRIEEGYIDDNIKTSKIVWTGTSDKTANDVSGYQERQYTKSDGMKDWLLDYLSDGAKQVSDIYNAAKEEGFNKWTLDKVKKDNKHLIESYRTGFNGGWHWKLKDNKENDIMEETEATEETGEAEAPEIPQKPTESPRMDEQDIFGGSIDQDEETAEKSAEKPAEKPAEKSTVKESESYLFKFGVNVPDEDEDFDWIEKI